MTKRKSPPVETAQSITSIESDIPYFDDDPLNSKADVKAESPLQRDGQLVVTDPPPDPDLADPPADPDPSAGSGQALAQVISDDQLALKDLPTNATLKDLTALQDALITLDVKPGDVFASRVNLQTGQVTIITTDARKLIYPPKD